MADRLFSYNGAELVDKKTFKASASIEMGTPVKLDTGTEDYVNAATNAAGPKYIGFIEPDEQHEAENGTTYFASGDLLSVALRGPVFRGLCGSVVAIGDIISICGTTNLGVLGRLVTDPDGQVSGTDAIGIALQAGINGGKVDFIKL